MHTRIMRTSLALIFMFIFVSSASAIEGEYEPGDEIDVPSYIEEIEYEAISGRGEPGGQETLQCFELGGPGASSSGVITNVPGVITIDSNSPDLTQSNAGGSALIVEASNFISPIIELGGGGGAAQLDDRCNYLQDGQDGADPGGGTGGTSRSLEGELGQVVTEQFGSEDASVSGSMVFRITNTEPSPPEADFTADPETAQTEEEITFDASSSSDPNDQDLSFIWQDGRSNLYPDEEVITQSYINEGEVEMELTVENEDGLTDTHTEVVTIEDIQEPASFQVEPLESSSLWDPDGIENQDESAVRVEVENTGDESATKDVTYDAGFDGTSTSVSLDPGESTEETLTVFPEEGDAGNYEGNVFTEDDSFSVNFEVLQGPDFFIDDVVAEDIVEGEILEVEATIVNRGEVEGTQVVEMDSGVGSDSEEITLSREETAVETFTTGTSVGDAGSYDAIVSSNDDSMSDDFQVEPEEFALDISHIGDGSGSTNPAEGTTFFDSGETVEVTASADSGSEFQGFGGDCSGTSCTVTMDQDKDVTAEFAELDPAEFEVSNVDADSTVTEGNSYSVSATVENIGEQTSSTTVDASSSVGSDSDGTGTLDPGQSTSVSFSIGTDVGDGEDTVTTDVDSGDDTGSDSTFIQYREYDIVCSISGSGSVSGDCGDTVERTGSFSPSASASDGWEFDDWSGDYSSTSASPTFTADDSSATGDEIQLTANFRELDPAFFEVSATERSAAWEPNGREDQDRSSVRLRVENTGEISDTQTIEYDTGFGTDSTTVSLDPGESTGDFGPILDVMPSVGDEGSYTGTVSSDDDSFDVSIVIDFKEYSVNCDINGQGSVGSDCNSVVERTDSVTVSADPDDGWAFGQWTGDTLSRSSTTTVTSSVSSDIDTTANFAELGVNVSVSDRTYSEPQSDNIPVSVENTGDIEDSYEFSGQELDNPNNWDITLPSGNIELSPGQTDSLTFDIEVPENADDGESLIVEYELISNSDPSIADSDTFTATVEFDSDFGLEIADIDPDPVTEGDNFDIIVDIENRAPFEDDTFLTVDSDVDGQSSRTVELSPSSSIIETFSFSTVEGDGGQSYTAEADETSSGSTDQESFFVEVASILVCESTSAEEGSMWIFDNSFRFSDGSEECFLDGADIVDTDTGGEPGNIWVDGDSLHWVDQSGTERSYTGPSIGSASGSEGAAWVDDDLFYVDQSGNIRIVDGT